MLTMRIQITIGVLVLMWGSAWAQSIDLSSGIWERPEWRKRSFTSPLSVEATYRRVYGKLSACFAGYSFRVLGDMNGDYDKGTSKAEVLVVNRYRQSIYDARDIYFAFQITPAGSTRSVVDSYQSTRFSEVFVAAAPGWLGEGDAPCRIR